MLAEMNDSNPRKPEREKIRENFGAAEGILTEKEISEIDQALNEMTMSDYYGRTGRK